VALEGVEAPGPQPPVRPQPGVDLRERLGTDPVQASLRVDADLDQAGVPQHPQMLRHPRLAERDPLHQIADGELALADEV
jgi:hypothetical protein